jgi:hypothetical protein
MPPIEVYHKSKKTTLKTAGERENSRKEDDQTSNAERFSGILKIKNPRIIEEIAESDLLV